MIIQFKSDWGGESRVDMRCRDVNGEPSSCKTTFSLNVGGQPAWDGNPLEGES